MPAGEIYINSVEIDKFGDGRWIQEHLLPSTGPQWLLVISLIVIFTGCRALVTSRCQHKFNGALWQHVFAFFTIGLLSILWHRDILSDATYVCVSQSPEAAISFISSSQAVYFNYQLYFTSVLIIGGLLGAIAVARSTHN